ncbi:hypothetical protein ATCC90586_008575 [Pythium insidiosum]|nr:hypothetical protein ATCC90586_008575 [Pythium insidiosum]
MMNWRGTDLESLDYDIFESVVNKSGMGYKYRDGLERSRLVYARWFLTLLVGLVTALVAVFLLYCTSMLQAAKHLVLTHAIEHELSKHVLLGTAFWLIVGFNLVLVLVAATITCFGEPVAAGSGISEVKTTLNGMKIPRMLRMRTFFCKVIGTICSVAGGLPVGKEGPMIHSGAIVAAGLSQGKSSTFSYDTSFTYFAGFRNDREKRDFVSCGAAAGVAAAFGAPIGGVLFVLEEGASFWNQQLTWRTLFCAMAGTFTLAFFLSGMNDNLSWGTLGSHTGTFTFGSFSSSTYQLWEVPLFILMGVGGGLQGALFNSLNTKLSLLRSRWVRTRRVAWMEALMISVLVSSLTFAFPFLLGKCHPLPSVKDDLTHLMQPGVPRNRVFNFAMETLRRNATACICESCTGFSLDGADCFHADDTAEYPYKKELVQFYCPSGQYNDLASLMLSGGEVAIKHLFHAPPNSFDVHNLVVFWVVMLLLACVTYGLKVPSGLFVPGLLIGAAYGRLWTRVINYFTDLGHAKTVDPRTYGLIGSAAMLGGITRMTISLTVIILECTGNIEYGLPLILTLFFARWVGNYFNEGIYDIHIHLRRVPFLDWNPSLRGSFLRVKHIMTPNPKTLRTVERAGVIFDLLVSTKHNAFPVIVEDPTFGNKFFAGVILRKQLNVLLSHRDFCGSKPKPFSRHPHPAASVPDSSGHATNKQFRDKTRIDDSDADQQLLNVASDTANYCLSYRDMEAHYPRYPIPVAYAAGDTSVDLSETGGVYTLSEEDRALWVDLTPYINQTPYTIQEEAPFVRAYRLFRSAGLRHLVVVNRHNNVRGIITRRELEEEHCTRCFKLAKNVDPEDIYPLSSAPPRLGSLFPDSSMVRPMSTLATTAVGPAQRRKLRVLCLHGMYQNGTVFANKTQHLRRSPLDDVVEFVYLDGPVTLVPKILSQQQRPARRQDANNNRYATRHRVRCDKKLDEFRAWWRPASGSQLVSETQLDDDREVLVAFLQQQLTELGQLDGVMGFSQGASLASWMCTDQGREELQWSPRLAILIGSYLGPPQYCLNSGVVDDVASLHIFGSNDHVISAAKSQTVADIFKASQQHEHQVLTSIHHQGHVVPKSDQVQALFHEFLHRQHLALPVPAPAPSPSPSTAPPPSRPSASVSPAATFATPSRRAALFVSA